MGQPYDSNFHPPIPIIKVYFGLPEENLDTGPFDAIIDTGADTTVVPKEILYYTAARRLRARRGE
jgi:predicted aspartyl protease